jgi:hypothetical protein
MQLLQVGSGGVGVRHFLEVGDSFGELEAEGVNDDENDLNGLVWVKFCVVDDFVV